MAPTIKIENLVKTFGNIQAVDGVSCAMRKGEVIALLGPNGAGKSTLMNMIAGYLAPTSGEIEILGKNIAEDPIAAKRSIGFLPEGAPLYPDMSVRRFLEYMAALRGVGAQGMDKAVKQAKIKEVLGQKIETLSKGYQRRVGFAQAILSDPPILLLDEPTDGLDPNQKEHIRALVSEMGKDKTILISTHLLEEAETVATRIIVFAKGRIRADGALPQILKAAGDGAKTLPEAFRELTKEKKE